MFVINSISEFQNTLGCPAEASLAHNVLILAAAEPTFC